METGRHPEPSEGRGERAGEWAGLQSLLELARRAHLTELSPERREQIRERVLERLERNEVRRRRQRTLVAGASALLLAGVLLTLVVRVRRER
jgi:hypothetical protein